MADGLRCKHCGWQETDHVTPEIGTQDEYSRIRPGYRMTLDDCPEFELSLVNQRVSQRITAKRVADEEWAGKVWEARAELYERFLAGELYPLMPY